MRLHAVVVLGAGMCALAAPPAARTGGDEILTVVYSSAYNGYVRPVLPDGSFKPEAYAFGEGEHAGGVARDQSIEDYSFARLARLLTPYLARENYRPSQSSAGTDLLIVVHWGATTPYDSGSYGDTLSSLQAAMVPLQKFGGPPAPGTTTRGSQPSVGSSNAYRQQLTSQVDGALAVLNLQNRLRDRADANTAALLGYLPAMSQVSEAQRFGGLGTLYHDLISDVEEGRYYVILAAYDFQRAWKQKQLKLLWVTRVSIRAHGNRFDDGVEAMIRSAARYLGQTSPGLIRQRVSEGRVDVGEPKVIGVVPDAGR